MKLYATITSERGKSVGKGGNKYLNIELLGGSQDNPIINYYIIYTTDGMSVQDNGGILLDTTDSEGKKQKGENRLRNVFNQLSDRDKRRE